MRKMLGFPTAVIASVLAWSGSAHAAIKPLPTPTAPTSKIQKVDLGDNPQWLDLIFHETVVPSAPIQVNYRKTPAQIAARHSTLRT